MAEVLEADEDDVSLSYMVRSGLMYKWPELKEVSYQPLSDVICIMKPPVLANERAQFRFCADELESIKTLFKKKHVYFK